MKTAINDDTFPVRSCSGHGFYAGHVSAGRQTLITTCASGFVVVIEFDGSGTLLERTRLDLPKSMLRPGIMRGFYEINEEQLQTFLQREIGFKPGLIRVKEFHLPQELVEVYRLPKHFQEFLANPNDPGLDDEERGVLPDRIKAWLAAGQFVLACGNDYWLNGEGEVVSS